MQSEWINSKKKKSPFQFTSHLIQCGSCLKDEEEWRDYFLFNQDTTETPADQEEGIDEAADEVDVEDINDNDDDGTDRQARKLEGTDDETEGKLVLLYHL